MVTQTMASQNPEEIDKTETVPGGLTPDDIGMEFVRQYYTLMNEAPHYLYRLYSKESKFVHGSIVGKHQTPIIGQEKIRMEIERLNFQQVYTKIRQVDCYSTLHDLLIVLICGEISILKNPARRFAQQIVLAPQGPLKYYVVNDVFRYIDEDCNEVCETGGMETESSEGGQEEDVMRQPDPSSDQQMPNDIPNSATSVAVGPPSDILTAAVQQQQLMTRNDHLVDGTVPAGTVSTPQAPPPAGVTGPLTTGNPPEQDYLLINSRGPRTNGNVDIIPSADINPSEDHQNNFVDVFQQDAQLSGVSSSHEQSVRESSGGGDIQAPLQMLNEQASQFNELKHQEDGLDDASTTVQLSACNESQSEETAPATENTNGGIKTWASVTTGMGSSPAKKAPMVVDSRGVGAPNAAPPAVSGQFQGNDNFASAKPQRGPGSRNAGRQQPYGDNIMNTNSGSPSENRSFERKPMNNRGGALNNQFNGQAQNGYQPAPSNSSIPSGTFPPASESPNPAQMSGERGGPAHFGGGRGGGNWGSGGGAQMGGPPLGGFQSAPDDFQIFVGNLPADVTQEELKRRFAEFGPVVDVRINRGNGGIPFGFVVFDNRESVQKILELTQGADQTRIYVRNNTHRINIEEKKPRSGPLNRNSGGRFQPGMKQGGGGGNWSGGNQGPPRGPGGDGTGGGGKFMKGGPGGGGQMNKPRGGGKFGANDSQPSVGGGSLNGGAQQQQTGPSFNNNQPFQNSYGPRR